VNEEAKKALETDRVIDITTIGRQTGLDRRIEIWFHNIGGRIFITGMPGRRAWYANLAANPQFTFHLKDSAQADLAATARLITKRGEKRSVFELLLPHFGRSGHIDEWVAGSPLVEVGFLAGSQSGGESQS